MNLFKEGYFANDFRDDFAFILKKEMAYALNDLGIQFDNDKEFHEYISHHCKSVLHQDTHGTSKTVYYHNDIPFLESDLEFDYVTYKVKTKIKRIK